MAPGAASTVFGVVNAVLLDPLPFEDSEASCLLPALRAARVDPASNLAAE